MLLPELATEPDEVREVDVRIASADADRNIDAVRRRAAGVVVLKRCAGSPTLHAGTARADVLIACASDHPARPTLTRRGHGRHHHDCATIG